MFARNLLTVGVGTGLSRLLGFARDIMLAAALGSGAVADAFVATRLADSGAGRVAGAIDPRGLDAAAVLARAFPG